MMKQQTVRARGLIPVVLDDDRLSRQARQEERGKGGTGGMNQVRCSNELPELKNAGLADYAERKFAVVVISRGSLRRQGGFELGRTFCIAQLREPAGKRKNNGFNATDAGGEKVGIDQEFHDKFF